MASTMRVPLRKHKEDIRRWVSEGKSDEWIGVALGTSSASVQSFRSRHGIYRHTFTRVPEMKNADNYEGVIESDEGVGMWLDPEVSESRHWRKSWASVDAVKVYISAEYIVIVSA